MAEVRLGRGSYAAEGPPYEEVRAAKSALLKRRELSRIESAVWPETEEPDEA